MKPEVVPYHGGPKDKEVYRVPTGMLAPTEIILRGEGVYTLQADGYKWRPRS